MEISEESGTLRIGEFHPAAPSAMEWIRSNFLEDFDRLLRMRESLASCALSGNRLAEICYETLRRVIEGEPVSDRYLLGLAWFLKEIIGETE